MMSGASYDGRTFGLRLSFYFAALFAVYGVQLPYFSVWLDWRGLTPVEIGMVTAAPLFLRLLIGPTAAFLADRSGDHRRAVVVVSACGFAAVVALTQSQGTALIFLMTGVFLVGTQTGGPIGEAIALAGVRRLGVDYGRMRLWGSLSFIAATFIGGATLGEMGPGSIIWLLAGVAALLFLAAWLLPRAVQDDAVTAKRLTLSEVGAMASSRSFLLFLAATGAVQASHAVFYGFGVLHWQTLGIGPRTSSILWSISVIAEVGLFAYAGRVLGKVGPRDMILVGATAGVVRWAVMALDPPVAALVPLQMLHALSFGATHLGAMHYIQRSVPANQAGTAQSLLAAVTGGIGMGAAMLVAGVLYGSYGGLSYLAMAAISALGLIAGLLLRRDQVS